MNRLLVLIFLVGCSTTSKNKTTNLNDVKAEDFKKTRVINYRKKDDYFNKVKSQFSEASNAESLQRIFVYDGDITLEGDLGKIAKLCYERNFDEAQIIIKNINQKYLKNPIFWNQVGTCYLLQKERRKALLFYNKALAIKGDYAPSLNNLGVMYINEGDFSRALVAFNKARKAREFSRTPRINLANLYINFGLYNQAIVELDALYNISKRDVDVLNLLGTAHLMQNDISKSVGYFSKVNSNFLEEPRFGINYALALFLNGKEEKARDVLSDVNQKNLGSWKRYYKSVQGYLGVKL